MLEDEIVEIEVLCEIQESVKACRLHIARNTYEREMFDKASLKLGLDKAVLQSMGNEKVSKVSLSKLLIYIIKQSLTDD